MKYKEIAYITCTTKRLKEKAKGGRKVVVNVVLEVTDVLKKALTVLSRLNTLNRLWIM